MCEHGLPCHATVARACAALQSKAKNFIGCLSPSRKEAGRLWTFKNADDAKRFYSAVQNEITRLALYSLEEEARRYVLGEVRVRTKDKPTSIR